MPHVFLIETDFILIAINALVVCVLHLCSSSGNVCVAGPLQASPMAYFCHIGDLPAPKLPQKVSITITSQSNFFTSFYIHLLSLLGPGAGAGGCSPASE
ncbi:hypothetical protein ARMSODRAFT_387230 [Armillaria solidipes]|uniref:Uncharacterized protein n=1 Tax=Armillaria solidipes TaxID=1076256 RepID=A0A2H3CGU1_9AGAR|nr:hypothetical protein ARMSODRAFT_387230 [Armillaria solidipes]